MGVTRLTEQDVVRAARSHYLLKLTRPAMAAFTVVFTLIALIVIVSPAPGASSTSMPWVIGFALMAWLGSLLYTFVWGVPKAAKKQVRELASYRGDFDYRWSDNRFTAHADTGYSDMAWHDLHAWHRYKGGYTLYPSSGLYFIIPDRVLDHLAEGQVMVDALMQAGVREYRYFRRMR